MKSVKLASILFYLNSVFVVSCFVSCGSSPTEASSLLTADIRGGMDKPGLLGLGDEIKGVTFVPLEVTTDDASLIDGVYDYAVTDRYIYVLPVKEPRIVLFDRQGRFIRTLVKEGQGPGEFSGILPCIQVDERNDRFFLFSNNRVWEYTLEGEFIGQSTHEYSVIYMRHIGKDRFAAISFPFQPFNGGGFGLGLFSRKGDTIAIKNDFYSFLLPHEKSGFTTSIAPAYSDAQNSVLFKTGSNDTVFCISADRISAACVLDLKNSDAEVIRSLDVTDMSNLRIEKKDPKDIFVQDMIEFPEHYYFRLLYNQGYYIASVDKKTGKTLVEKCEMPGSIYELADANLQHGMQGTRSYRNFPVWGRVIKDELVQVVTPYELNLYKSLRSITIPQELNLKGEEGNPVMIGAVMVWKVKDTYRAMFDIDSSSISISSNKSFISMGESSELSQRMQNYENFVQIQSDAAIRKIAGMYAYDYNESKDPVTLRSDDGEVAQKLEEELNSRLAIAGIEVLEARINYLAYASEIAGVMLRRQQAEAIIAARERIVEGAVSMVQLALNKLDKDNIVELDEERKAAMVSNLLVVLCADEAAQPVVNTGTLHH